MQAVSAQNYYFGRWLNGYVRTNPRYFEYRVRFGKGSYLCEHKKDNRSDLVTSKIVNPDNLFVADALVTNPKKEIVLMVKIEIPGLQRSRIEEYVGAIIDCDRCQVYGAQSRQFFLPTSETKYIIAGIYLNPVVADKSETNLGTVVKSVFAGKSRSNRLDQITVLLTTKGQVLAELKREIKMLMPWQAESILNRFSQGI